MTEESKQMIAPDPWLELIRLILRFADSGKYQPENEE